MEMIVETKTGKVCGEKIGNLFIFKGIPYAEPPLGQMRWMPPKKKEPWNDIWEAKEYKPISPQPEFEFMEGALFKEKQSEDCLYLNIYTPGPDEKKRPVMVWIHGGAFMVGSSSHPLYRKGRLANNDVVLVTINYRLGAFGFLRLKDIGVGKIPSTGNEGLMDQICAIKWVRDNIEFFGGDPENITLFGESAGGISIACILAMEKNKNLFNKVIIQSGNAEAVFDKEKSTEYARTFLKILNIPERNVEGIMDFSQDHLVKAEEELLKKSGELTVFSPTIDDEHLIGRPIDLIKKERISEMPLLIGTNLHEWNLFSITNPEILNMDIGDLKTILRRYFSEKDIEEVICFYSDKLEREKAKLETWRIYSQFMTDTFFLLPTLRIVEKWVSFGVPVFLYLFTWPSPYLKGRLGACHTLELGFLFGNYDERFFGSGQYADELSKKMQGAWTAFAKTGNPSCESIGMWSDFGKERKVMILGKECYLMENPHRDVIEFYSSLGMT